MQLQKKKLEDEQIKTAFCSSDHFQSKNIFKNKMLKIAKMDAEQVSRKILGNQISVKQRQNVRGSFGNASFQQKQFC